MTSPGLFSGLAVFIVLGILGCGLLRFTREHRRDLKFQVKLFLVAYCFRFALSLTIYQTGLVNLLGDEDASGWYNGVVLEQRWEAEKVSLLDIPGIWIDSYHSEGHKGYFYLLGVLFFITGTQDRLVAAACNCFFGALTVIFAFRVAQTLFSDWVAMRAAWFTAFMPSLVIWSAQTVKEPIVIFLETITLYACLHLKARKFAVRYVVATVAGIVLMIPFRFYAAYLAAAAALLALALPDFGRKRMSLSSGLVVAGLLLAALIPTKVLLQNEAQFEKFNLKYAQSFRQGVASGTGSGVDLNYDLQTASGLFMAVTVGTIYILLAPFPWQWGSGSARLLLTIPELLFWWYLFFTAIAPAIYYTIKKRFNDIQPFLFYLVGLVFLYSVMFGNVGLAYRQRAQLLPFLLVLAAVGQERRLQQKQQQQLPDPAPVEQGVVHGA